MTAQARKATGTRAPDAPDTSTVDEPGGAVIVGVGDEPTKNDDGTLTVGVGQVMLAPPVPVKHTDCVVKDAGEHVGYAVPGTKVCSRHTMHYNADGSPRGK